MTYHLVYRIRDAAMLARTLFRDDITFVTPPMTGDTVFWDSDWGGSTVTYRYIGKDWIELGLGVVGTHEIESYVAAGWVLR